MMGLRKKINFLFFFAYILIFHGLKQNKTPFERRESVFFRRYQRYTAEEAFAHHSPRTDYHGGQRQAY